MSKEGDSQTLADLQPLVIKPLISKRAVGKTHGFLLTHTANLNSGPVNWLLRVIAPDRKATGQVIANFRQVVKEGDLRNHPIVAGLVDEVMRGKMMGAAGHLTATADNGHTDQETAASLKPPERKED